MKQRRLFSRWRIKCGLQVEFCLPVIRCFQFDSEGPPAVDDSAVNFRSDAHEWGQHDFIRVGSHHYSALDHVELERVNVLFVLVIFRASVRKYSIDTNVHPD